MTTTTPTDYRDAAALLCLATSPRFRDMTVRAALLELIDNGALRPAFAAVLAVELEA